MRVAARNVPSLAGEEPDNPGNGQRAGDVEVQPQAEDVVSGVDPEGLLEDAEGRVAGYVEGEEARWADAPMAAEPDEEGSKYQIPDQLIEKGRVEGGEALIAGRPVRR